MSPKSSVVTIYKTDLISEIHAEFGVDGQPKVQQITRLIKGKDYVEVEYLVNSIPIDDGIGKEIVSRFSTDIQSSSTFFTDSNGREFIKRTRGDIKLFGEVKDDPVAMEPIAANYYPVNAAIYIEDDDHSLSVLVDRSQGGSSLTDGSVELMIQRRLLADDSRGCDEPLNETDIGITPNAPYGDATRMGHGIVIKGFHRLMIGQGRSGASKARSRMDEIFSQPHIFVSSAPSSQDMSFRQSSFSALQTSLPDTVMLITYAQRDAHVYLVRLAHNRGPDESSDHSVPVEIDLSALFSSKTIISFTEKTLSGNRNYTDWKSNQLHWRENDNMSIGSSYRDTHSRNLEEAVNIIVLHPLEIRTFEVVVG